MSDSGQPAAHRDDGPASATAIISYLLILVFTVNAAGVYLLIWFKIQVEAAMLTLLGGIDAAAVAALGIVGGFWLSSTLASRRQAATGAPPAAASPGRPLAPPDDLPGPPPAI